jgi:hypothetical protein
VSDIFIAYSSKNETQVEQLYDCLKEQWNVIYDYFTVGDFNAFIEENIENSKCLLAVFSSSSRESDYFKDELALAKKFNKPIIGVKLDKSDNPLGYGNISFCDFNNWDESQNDKEFIKLKTRISTVVKPNKSTARPSSILNENIQLPVLFQSVSSFETQLPTHEAVAALDVFRFPTILISAYDLQERSGYDSSTFIKNLTKYKENGGYILLDSGNYEKCRKNDETWNENKLYKTISGIPHDFMFCFDEYDLEKDIDNIVEQIEVSVSKGRKYTGAPVLPIVHARKEEQGEYIFSTVPELVLEVAKRQKHLLIAIPERELGDGLIARVKNIVKIREQLNNLPHYQPIHILGTGDPIVIPLFIAAGADSFDGLEWCRKVVDRDEYRLHHFHHFDLFSYQAQFAESRITREALANSEIKFIAKVIFHNLDFYDEFIGKIREAAINGNIRGFITENFPKPIWSQVMKNLAGIIKI